MAGFIITVFCLGVVAFIIWLFIQMMALLFSFFVTLLSFAAMIITGKWLWDFINKEDDESESEPKQ